MTIGELASRAGVRVSTIRYYERLGLMRPSGRTAANYRQFGQDALRQLRFIRSARASGLALENIRSLLAARGGQAVACTQVRSVIDARLAEVTCQIEKLRRTRRTLKSLHGLCDRNDDDADCPALEALEERGS